MVDMDINAYFEEAIDKVKEMRKDHKVFSCENVAYLLEGIKSTMNEEIDREVARRLKIEQVKYLKKLNETSYTN